MQLIDRDAINWCDIMPDNPRQLDVLAILKSKHFVEEQPVIDAEPVVYAEWLPYEFGDETWHVCSHCGVADKYGYKVVLFMGEETTSFCIRNYCPNCGARMRGKV